MSDVKQGEVLLGGPDGGTLMGFLSVLGVMRLTGCKARWVEVDGVWRAVVDVGEGWVEGLWEAHQREVREWLGCLYTADGPMPDVRQPAEALRQRAETSAWPAIWSAIVTDAALGNDGRTALNPLVFTPVAQSKWVKNVENVFAACTSEKLARTLSHPWAYADDAKTRTMTWDPREHREHALMAEDPSKGRRHEAATTELGASALSLHGLPLITAYGASGRVTAVGFRRSRAAGLEFVWPLWRPALSAELVRLVLTQPHHRHTAQAREALGVAAVWSCPKLKRGKYANFGPATAR